MGIDKNENKMYIKKPSVHGSIYVKNPNYVEPTEDAPIPDDIYATTTLHQDDMGEVRTKTLGKALLWITILIVACYVIVPTIKQHTENKHNTFNITVEVEKVYQPGNYHSKYESYLGWNIEQPVMKCKIVDIARNDYQKNHNVPGEPLQGDIIYITEIHGDSYSQFSKIDLTLVKGEIQGGQFKKFNGESLDDFAYETEYDSSNVSNNNTTTTSNITVTTEQSNTYIQDLRGWIPDDQEENIQKYLEEKYAGTGIRVYLIFFDTNDTTYMDDYADALLDSKRGLAISYARNANDNSWRMRWLASDKTENEYIKAHTSTVNEAYLIYGTYEERLTKVIDTAYELYEGN